MSESEYVAIRDDFFSKPLSPVSGIVLMGTRCRECGDVYLGKAAACQQCQCRDLEAIRLSREGKLYSYTICRNRPPGDYRGPDNPFQPFPLGLVELPEGCRVVAAIDCDIEKVRIDMPLSLSIQELYNDEAGRTVLTYKFRPVE